MTLPRLDLKKRDYPCKYQIQGSNRIQIQSNYECAAYSTAYVLRHFGIEADGSDIHAGFPSKMASGCVYPKGIRTYLKQQGFQTRFFKGNIETLKTRIAQGVPVIVFIKVNKARNFLHYVPVTGYDEKYLYLAESLEHLVNFKEVDNNYNRRVPIEEFKSLWDIKSLRMPFYSNTYITVDRI